MNDEQFERLITSVGERRVLTKQSTMERHAQTILVALMVLLISWVGVSLVAVGDKQAEFNTELVVTGVKLENLTAVLKQQQQNYVRVVDFIEFKTHVEDRLDDLEREQK